MHTPTKCVIPDCETTLPLVDMFEHQEMHRMQFELEWEHESNSSSPRQAPSSVPPSPQRQDDEWMDVDDDDGYASDDAPSPTTRPQGLRRLHRNWAALSRLSRPPSRLPSPRASPSTSPRPLPPLPRAVPGQFPFLGTRFARTFYGGGFNDLNSFVVVRVINDYQATDEGELSIEQGDLLRITGIRHDGWWEGHNIDSDGSISGLIPRIFVELFPPPAMDVTAMISPSWKSKSSFCVARWLEEALT